jgi:hypothetical protein
MSRFSQLVTALAMTAIALPAFADTTTYEFTAKNTSKVSMTVSVDGKIACSADAGKSCRLSFAKGDAALAYSLAGASPVPFTTGNIEAADVCNIDASGAHCMTPDGQPTN